MVVTAYRSSKSVFVKRVYEAPEPADGYRVLVDRLWPRGLSKDAAKVDLWLKQAAPSTALREWFDHRAERWPHFLRRYRIELKAEPEGRDAFSQLVALVSEKEKVTLLFGAKEPNRNNAVALQVFLNESAPSSA